MSQTMVLDVMRNGFLTIIKVASPVLIVALVVGLFISILQATTQVQEQTLSFVPKLMAVMGALIVFGPFMLNTLLDFARRMFTMIANLN